MHRRPWLLFTVVFALAGTTAVAQQADAQAANPPAPTAPVIKTETRMVLVDTVVTDKKGNYIRDLEAKDFRVWEDNKEQTVKTFSFEAGANAPANSQRRYLVLFFDNSNMDPADQVRARDAASKFIDSNAGPNRLVAIVNFGGSVRIAQNFTADVDRLKKIVMGVKIASVSANPTAEGALLGPSLGNLEMDFGARSLMLGLRSLAKNLASVPGRKTLVLLSSGFPLTEEARSELTATINMCNRSNVAVYPIDVRGLVASMGWLQPPSGPESVRVFPAAFTGNSPFRYSTAFFAQRPGGGGGGGGIPGGGGGAGGGRGGAPGGGAGAGAGAGAGGARGGTGGGTGAGAGGGRGGTGGGNTGGANTGGGKSGGGGNTGGRGGGTTGGNRGGGGGNSRGGYVPGQPYLNNPYNSSRRLIPEFPQSATTNQEVLYALAQGTGGFVILNTNDLLGGLEKIGKELNEYYVLGYVPTESVEGSCHTLKVKVERGGSTIRSRSGYCNVRPVDILAGNSIEKELEAHASGSSTAGLSASMTTPFFYTSPNIARVNVAMELPTEGIKFDKVKGKFKAEVNILGIAYKPDGTVGGRFSDTVKLNLENKKEMEAFREEPFHYENQFELASGQYTLKVVFSSDQQNFGKVEAPLAIDPYDGKQFILSGLALSKEFHRLGDLDTGLDAELLGGRTPLTAQGMQIVPAGRNIFKKSEASAVYLEVYEPLLLGPNPPDVGVQLRIVDRKTGEQKVDTGLMNMKNSVRPDNPVIPVGLKLPVETLTAGIYRVELKAMDSAGRASTIRAADFEVQ